MTTETRSPADILTLDDVAAELKCSTTSVRRLVKAGKLPRPAKLGQLSRWSRRSIIAAVDRLHADQQAPSLAISQ